MKTIAVKRMLVTKSTLKMILHTEKAMKTTIQKNLFTKSPKSAEFRCSETIFFSVHSNFTYDSEAGDLMKLYFKTLLEILVSSQLHTLYSS